MVMAPRHSHLQKYSFFECPDTESVKQLKWQNIEIGQNGIRVP